VTPPSGGADATVTTRRDCNTTRRRTDPPAPAAVRRRPAHATHTYPPRIRARFLPKRVWFHPGAAASSGPAQERAALQRPAVLLLRHIVRSEAMSGYDKPSRRAAGTARRQVSLPALSFLVAGTARCKAAVHQEALSVGPDALLALQTYTGTWATELWSSPVADPLCCLASTACPCATSYALRKRALKGDLRYYTCCAGHMPCSGKCGESNCPEVCLATEVSCCFPNSVVSTRYLLQDQMIIANTPCDDVLVGCLICTEQLACIFRCAGDITGSPALEEAGTLLTVAADMTYCSVCGCMQVQHKLQLDALEEGRYVAPAFVGAVGSPQYGAVGAPPQQGMYA